MPAFRLQRAPQITGSAESNEQLRKYLNRMVDALTWVLSNLDSENIREGGLNTAALKGLDAEMINVAKSVLGKAKIGAAQVQNLEAQVAKIVTAKIGTMDVDWASIAALTAVIAEITKATVSEADIDFAKIKDLLADKQIITQGEAGELYIADLAVTEGNMVRLTLGQLLLKGADGKYYELTVEDGKVVANQSDVAGALEDGSVSGEKLVEGSITADKLNVQDIFADSALIRELLAMNLDVDTLFAREATINALNAMDILANEQLRITLEKQDALNAQIKAWFNFTEDGVLGIGRSDTAFSTTISFEELAFWYYSTKVAYMRGDKLHTPNVVIEESMTFADLTAEKDGDFIIWS